MSDDTLRKMGAEQHEKAKGAPADVLAAMKAAEDRLFAAIPNAGEVFALATARAAVAELITACHERDASRDASLAATKAKLEARRAGLPEPDSRAAYSAASDADDKYFAALARVGGAK